MEQKEKQRKELTVLHPFFCLTDSSNLLIYIYQQQRKGCTMFREHGYYDIQEIVDYLVDCDHNKIDSDVYHYIGAQKASMIMNRILGRIEVKLGSAKYICGNELLRRLSTEREHFEPIRFLAVEQWINIEMAKDKMPMFVVLI